MPFQSRLSRRALLGATTASAAGLALTGCGGDDDESAATATPAAGTDTSPATQASPTRAPRPSEFVVANEAEPDDLLPYFSGFAQVLVLRNVYETLFEVRLEAAPDGSATLKYVPMLAEKWEQTAPDTFRFTLRKNVLFHDGEPWDANAAKASFDALRDPQTASALKKAPYLARAIKAVNVVDSMTIDIVTAEPTNINELGLFIRLFFSAVSPKALKDRGLPAMLESPVGTGPFRLEAWTRGQQIRLSKFDRYWDPNATNIPAARFITRKEASVRAQTIKTGEAHFAYNIGVEQGATLPRQLVAGGFQSNSIRLNNAIAPTNDIRVRRAINLAIDRDAINKSIFKGTAKPIGFFANQPVNVRPFPYDPTQAARLISEAGVKGTELQFVYGEGRIPEEDQLAEIFKSYLDAIGLKIRLTKLEPRQYNELGGKPFPEQPPLYMETTSNGNYGEVATALRDKYGCEGTGTFCKPEFDDLYRKIGTLSGDERQRLLQDVARRLQEEETPRCWVVAVNQVHGIAPDVVSRVPLNAYVLLRDFSFA